MLCDRQVALSLCSACAVWSAYSQKIILVAAELQVTVALLVMLNVHGFSVGAGEQASLHCLEACVGLCQVHACDGDTVSGLDAASQLSPQLDVQASGRCALRNLLRAPVTFYLCFFACNFLLSTFYSSRKKLVEPELVC